MPYVLRKFHCVECGAYTERKLSSKQPRRCAECGIAAMVRSTRQMAYRVGPAWEAFRASPGARGRPRKHDRED
jgi:hypothetical protein